jgi:DNA repair protein RecO (recombination protein O)
MDAETTEGIVLRLRPLTETSLIVTWFSRDFGKLVTVAKGARRPKSPFRGRLDLFFHDEMVWLRSRRSSLHLLCECFVEETFAKIRSDVRRFWSASWACACVEQATALEDAAPSVFELLAEHLQFLNLRGVLGAIEPHFQLQLLKRLGFGHKMPKSSADTAAVWQALSEADVKRASRVRLSAAQECAVREMGARFWEDAIGKPPPSPKMEH